MSINSPMFQEPSAGAPQEPSAVAPEEPAAFDESTLDEHTQKVIAAIRNDFKDERARRQAAETALKATEPKVAEYDRLAEASKTEQERTQEVLKAAEDRAQAATQRVARAEVKAALTGLVDNPDSIVEDLNLARFIDSDGEVDQDAIDKLKAKYAGFAGSRAPRPDQSQASGANGSSAVSPASTFASLLQSQLGSRG